MIDPSLSPIELAFAQMEMELEEQRIEMEQGSIK